MRPACVGSVTVTRKLRLAALPRVSLAVHATLVDPIANVLPDEGVHVTGRGPSARSSAVAVKLTTAPAGDVAAELSGTMPHATNNVAEYQGLIEALTWCADHGAGEVEIRSDSLLLVQQMRGVYKVKHEGLKTLHGRARLLAHQIGRVEFKHVPRDENKDADRLANLAMDAAAAARPAAT